MTRLVGILNLTPDSFSDGGIHSHIEQTLARIHSWVEQGLGIIDVGAESTRPGASPVSAGEEWKRLEPVLSKLSAAKLPVIVSIDTRHAETARRALALGAGWINDVCGFADPRMVEAAADCDAKLVIMHSLSIPADPVVTLPEKDDVIEALLDFGKKRVAEFEAKGIAKDRLIFDPGIGFGKSAEQSWEILRRWQELRALGLPILIGHSRKSFLKSVTDAPAQERDEATLAVSADLIRDGVDFLRVHDVTGHLKLCMNP